MVLVTKEQAVPNATSGSIPSTSSMTSSRIREAAERVSTAARYCFQFISRPDMCSRSRRKASVLFTNATSWFMTFLHHSPKGTARVTVKTSVRMVSDIFTSPFHRDGYTENGVKKLLKNEGWSLRF